MSVLGHVRRPGVPFGQSLSPKNYPRTRRPRVAAAFSICHRGYLTVTKLFVGNLPFTVTEDALRTLFAPHGTVEKIALISDRDTGRPRGFAFVEMSNADAARAMQSLNGTDFGGRPLKVNEAQERVRSSGGGGQGRY